MDRNEREPGQDGKATAEAVSPATAESAPNRLPKTDELLRQGEALFAQGDYDQAIHVWTRILFLERGDPRVKNAIDRAKRAVAERQRELDVELAGAAAALDAGELDRAAARVHEALEVDPRNAEAHQLAARVAALARRKDPATGFRVNADETKPPSPGGLLLRVARSSTPRLGSGAHASPLKLAGFVLGVILAFASGALVLHLNWESIVSDRAFFGGNGLPPGGTAPVVAEVPGPSELHYFNGARLYAKGRYREALVELSLVDREDAVFERARSLILRIEERLLRGGESPSSDDASRAATER